MHVAGFFTDPPAPQTSHLNIHSSEVV